MENLIVLGQIPGTHVQITFLFWQLVILSTLTLLTVRILRRRKNDDTNADDVENDKATDRTPQTA